MSAEKNLAIVLRVVAFSETSSIVTLFTRESGKIGALAKGARRPKGPFESALDVLALCRVVSLRRSSELDLLTEAKLERRFRGRGRDLSSLYAGYYVAELLTELTEQYDPHPALFDAAEETLRALCADDGGPVEMLTLRFELSALRELGHLPSLADCVECGTPIDRTGRVAFGQIDGGVLCPKCRPGKTHVVSVSREAILTLTRLAENSGDKAPNLPWSKHFAGELRGVMNQYMNHLFGRKSRLHPYLGP
jgi:DNA repair protein RecO (recombination protein O)